MTPHPVADSALRSLREEMGVLLVAPQTLTKLKKALAGLPRAEIERAFRDIVLLANFLGQQKNGSRAAAMILQMADDAAEVQLKAISKAKPAKAGATRDLRDASAFTQAKPTRRTRRS